jgi:hypothetical protein
VVLREIPDRLDEWSSASESVFKNCHSFDSPAHVQATKDEQIKLGEKGVFAKARFQGHASVSPYPCRNFVRE